MSERIDIGDYLLGELSEEQTAEAERLLREDPSFRSEAERLRPIVAALEGLPEEAWEQPTPPPLELPRAAAPPRGRASVSRESWWQRFMQRPLLAATASLVLVAVGLAGGVWLGSGDDQPSEPSQVLALAPVEPRGEGATGTAELIGNAGGEAVVEVSGIEPSADDEFYELWLLNSPDDLISLGSFRVDDPDATTVRVPLPADPAEFDFIDISVERDDGDESHSGKSLLRAPT